MKYLKVIILIFIFNSCANENDNPNEDCKLICGQVRPYELKGIVRSLPDYEPVSGIQINSYILTDPCITSPELIEFISTTDIDGYYSLEGETISCSVSGKVNFDTLINNPYNEFWEDRYPYDDETDILLFNSRDIKLNFIDLSPTTMDTLRYRVKYDIRVSSPEDAPIGQGKYETFINRDSISVIHKVPEDLEFSVWFYNSYENLKIDTFIINSNDILSELTFYYDE